MRKTKLVQISAQGRDFGKCFLLTEWPATKAERWGRRAIQAMAKGNADVPPDILDKGMAGFFVLGLKALAGAPPDEVDRLLDEMMECVLFVPDPSKPDLTRPLIVEDPTIEEVPTLLRLRDEVLELHTGFSVAGEWSRLTQKPEPSPAEG